MSYESRDVPKSTTNASSVMSLDLGMIVGAQLEKSSPEKR